MEIIVVVISAVVSLLTLIAILLGFRDKIFSHGGKEQKTTDRIAELEKTDKEFSKCIDGIKDDVKSIKENHLAHIEKDINNINVHLAEINTTLKFIVKEK